jgi:hypothetical protein
MSKAAESLPIDVALHHDLRAMAAHHPAAQLATSPLAKALAADIGDGSQVTNATLTAYAAAIEHGAVPSVNEADRTALVARLAAAFPGR